MKLLNVFMLAVIASAAVMNTAVVDAQTDAKNATDFVSGVGAPADLTDSADSTDGSSDGSVGATVPVATIGGTSMSGMDMDDGSSADDDSDASGSMGASRTVSTTPAPTKSSAVHAGVVGSVVTLAVTAAAALAC